MKQYKHQEFEFNPNKPKEAKALEEQIKNLENEVVKLTQRVEFLSRQDQRSRSSFEQIQSRINARK